APVRVCAAIGARYGAQVVDDDGILLITWSNGTNSIVESGWWQPHAGGLEADTELYGTRGYARVWGYTEPPGAVCEHCTKETYRALAPTDLGPGDIGAAAFGLAGVDWPSDEPRVRSAIDPIGLDGRYVLVNDSFVALRAGSREGVGVVLVAGTGAVAAGRNGA